MYNGRLRSSTRRDEPPRKRGDSMTSGMVRSMFTDVTNMRRDRTSSEAGADLRYTRKRSSMDCVNSTRRMCRQRSEDSSVCCSTIDREARTDSDTENDDDTDKEETIESEERPDPGPRCDSLVQRFDAFSFNTKATTTPCERRPTSLGLTRGGGRRSALISRGSGVQRPLFVDTAHSSSTATTVRPRLRRSSTFNVLDTIAHDENRRISLLSTTSNISILHALAPHSCSTRHSDDDDDASCALQAPRTGRQRDSSASSLLATARSHRRMSTSPRRFSPAIETPCAPRPTLGWGLGPRYGEFGLSEQAPPPALRALLALLQAGHAPPPPPPPMSPPTL